MAQRRHFGSAFKAKVLLKLSKDKRPKSGDTILISASTNPLAWPTKM